MAVTKLQVDVLVQAAMFGPMEAERWTPMADDPDELGRELMSSGRRASGERTGEDYVFEPLPVAITAVEAIKACAYYHYNRSKTPAVVQRIARAMESHLDGWPDAPWGWDSDDITARLGRPAPGSDVPSPMPPEFVEVTDRLSELGLDPVKIFPTVGAERDRRAGGAGAFYGSVMARYGERGHAQVLAIVAKSPETASRLFPYEVAAIVWKASNNTEVRRVGNLLVLADLWPTDESTPAIAAILDRLGTPDEHWSVTEPPVATAHGGLLSGRAEMALSHPAVARTAPELAVLIEALHDADTRERLRDVDLHRHSVLALPGEHLGEVFTVDVVRSGVPSEPAVLIEDLVLTAEYVSPQRQLGSVLLLPRLRRRPRYVRVRRRDEGRFGGWWKNISRLR
jgi:hypothetical protein